MIDEIIRFGTSRHLDDKFPYDMASRHITIAFIVWEIRTPRVLLAATVGAGLSTVGVVIQALVRNALADPFVLGVSSGASVGAVAVIVTGGLALAGIHAVSLGAFLGALVASAAVYALARGRAGTSPLRLVLVGVALAYGFQAAMGLWPFFRDHVDS